MDLKSGQLVASNNENYFAVFHKFLSQKWTEQSKKTSKFMDDYCCKDQIATWSVYWAEIL